MKFNIFLSSIVFILIGSILLCLYAFDDGPKEGNLSEIKQTYINGWGKIPKQNLCPSCGNYSFTKFCTNCRKERGNLPFVGVYCPKCEPDGKYASLTSDVTEICGDCGSHRKWKYVYKDWQTEPNEVKQ